MFFGPRAYFDLCEHTFKLRAEDEADPIGFFRRMAASAKGHQVTASAFGLVWAQDVPGGVLAQYEEQGVTLTAFHEFIVSTDTGMVQRVFARWKSGATADKCKTSPHFTEQYASRLTACAPFIVRFAAKPPRPSARFVRFRLHTSPRFVSISSHCTLRRPPSYTGS